MHRYRCIKRLSDYLFIKVCAAINDASSQMCFVCKSTISQLNKIDNMVEIDVDEGVDNGFSPMHAYIRWTEWVLHVAYKLELKKWKVCNY